MLVWKQMNRVGFKLRSRRSTAKWVSSRDAYLLKVLMSASSGFPGFLLQIHPVYGIRQFLVRFW